MMGVGTLCLVAIAAQSVGLMSVVRFVTTREGWEPKRANSRLSLRSGSRCLPSPNRKSNSTDKKKSEAEQKKATAERELEDILKRLASAKGELEKTRGQSPSFFRWAILKSLTLEPNDYGGRRRCTLLG